MKNLNVRLMVGYVCECAYPFMICHPNPFALSKDIWGGYKHNTKPHLQKLHTCHRHVQPSASIDNVSEVRLMFAFCKVVGVLGPLPPNEQLTSYVQQQTLINMKHLLPGHAGHLIGISISEDCNYLHGKEEMSFNQGSKCVSNTASWLISAGMRLFRRLGATGCCGDISSQPHEHLTNKNM